MKNKDISHSKSFKQGAVISLIVTLIAVVVLNVVASFFYFRVDLTKDKRHSLSKSTIELLKGLDDMVFIKVYMDNEGLPVSYQPVVTKTREMLEEFSSYSSNVKFEFIDPTADKTKEEINGIYAEFAQKGLTPYPVREQYAAFYNSRANINNGGGNGEGPFNEYDGKENGGEPFGDFNDKNEKDPFDEFDNKDNK